MTCGLTRLSLAVVDTLNVTDDGPITAHGQGLIGFPTETLGRG